MSKLHRGVGLSPRTEDLAHLERRLVGDRRGHPSTEENELPRVLRHGWRPGGELRDRLLCRCLDIPAERREDECQGACRKTRLHDRLFVGELKDDSIADCRGERTVLGGSDHDDARVRRSGRDGPDYFGRRPGTRNSDKRVVSAIAREL